MSLVLLLLRASKEYSYGSRSYVPVEKIIKKSTVLRIISPYIDPYYAEFLIRHAKGKRIRIISSSISKSAKAKLKRRSFSKFVAFVAFLLVLNMFLAHGQPALAFISLICSLIYLLVYLEDYETKKGILLKVPRRFVHAKVYIGDSAAVEGSANLTFMGMHKNIEQTRFIQNSEEVAILKNEFDKLWHRLG
ncbi:MAG: phospholipase D-like domain-containing protein [Candidatus Micrarchaeaceae archaeon]